MAGKKGAKGGGGDDILKKLEASITKLSETVNSLEGFIKTIEDDIKSLITNIGYFSENLKQISDSISDVKVIGDLVKTVTFVKNQLELLGDMVSNLAEKLRNINIPEIKENKKSKSKGRGGEEEISNKKYNENIEKFVISIENASKNLETFSDTITKVANGIVEIVNKVPKTKEKITPPPTVGISPDIAKNFSGLQEALNQINSNLEKLNSVFNSDFIISARIQTILIPLNKQIEDLQEKLYKTINELKRIKEQNANLNGILNEQKSMKEMQQQMNLDMIKNLSFKSFKASILDILTSRMTAMLSANFIPIQTFLFNFGGLAVGYLGKIFGQGGIQKSWLARLHKSLVWGFVNEGKSFTTFSYMVRGLTAPFKMVGKALGMKPKTEGKPAEKKGGILSNLLGGGKPPEKPPTGGGGRGGGGGDEKKNRNLIGGFTGALKGAGLLSIATGVAMIIDMFRRVASIIMDLEPIKVTNQMMMTMLKLVFLPVGMMLMGILMPIIITYFRMMQEVGWGNFITFMFNVGKTIGNIFSTIIKVFGTKNIMTAIMGMILIISAPLIAITLLIGVIMVIISAIAGAIGFVVNTIGNIFNWLSKLKLPSPSEIANAFKNLFSALGEGFEKVIEILGNVLIGAWKGIVNTFTTIFNSILGAINVSVGVLNVIYTWFTGILENAVNGIVNLVSIESNAISQFWGWISSSVMAVWNVIVDAIKGIEHFLKSLPSFQSGGYIPSTTVAVIHGGETVVPKGKVMMGGGGTNNIVININNEIHGAVDVDRMTDEIYQQLQIKLRRLRTW